MALGNLWSIGAISISLILLEVLDVRVSRALVPGMTFSVREHLDFLGRISELEDWAASLRADWTIDTIYL